jgi:hypothetical protein
MNPRRLAPPAFAALAAAALLGACASAPPYEAQWTDPQLGAQSGLLRGARVLVACDAADLTIRMLCQDRLAADVTARGATPVFVPPDTPVATDRALDAQLLPAARGLGAKAVMVVTIAPASADVSPGFSVGIGGFGFGRHSGVGVGVAAPIGGGRVTTGYSANGRVTEVGGGRLVWSARASAPPSSDIESQLSELTRGVFAAADQSGLF